MAKQQKIDHGSPCYLLSKQIHLDWMNPSLQGEASECDREEPYDGSKQPAIAEIPWPEPSDCYQA